MRSGREKHAYKGYFNVWRLLES